MVPAVPAAPLSGAAAGAAASRPSARRPSSAALDASRAGVEAQARVVRERRVDVDREVGVVRQGRRPRAQPLRAGGERAEGVAQARVDDERPVGEPRVERLRRRRAATARRAAAALAANAVDGLDDVLARRASVTRRRNFSPSCRRAAEREVEHLDRQPLADRARAPGRSASWFPAPTATSGRPRCTTFTWAWYGLRRSVVARRGRSSAPRTSARRRAGARSGARRRGRRRTGRGSRRGARGSVPPRGHQNSSASLLIDPVGAVLGRGQARHRRDPLGLPQHLVLVADQPAAGPSRSRRPRRSVVPSTERWSVATTKSTPRAKW